MDAKLAAEVKRQLDQQVVPKNLVVVAAANDDINYQLERMSCINITYLYRGLMKSRV